MRRFSKLRFSVMRNSIHKAVRKPNISIAALSPTGVIILIILKISLSCALTTATIILNTKRQTTSSKAVIRSSRSTNGPFPLYSFMVIIVLAGAVAVAIAPSKSEKDSLILKTKSITTVTKHPANRDSQSVIKTTFRNSFLPSLRLKYLPISKAIKLSAITEITSKLTIKCR